MSTEVATVPPSDAAALMQVISRAASDTSVDVNKLERLMAMYERISASRAKSAFDAALSEMQPKLPIVDRRGNIIIRDKNDKEKVIQSTPYALFEDINEAISPMLAEHGFAVSFRVGMTPDGKVQVTAILSHREGHREETTLQLMHDSTGSKNSVQAVGSSVSYGKRYTLCAILNITTRGEDDDGASATNKITDDQAAILTKMLDDNGFDHAVFLKWAGIDAIADLAAVNFGKAVSALNAKIAAKGKKT